MANDDQRAKSNIRAVMHREAELAKAKLDAAKREGGTDLSGCTLSIAFYDRDLVLVVDKRGTLIVLPAA